MSIHAYIEFFILLFLVVNLYEELENSWASRNPRIQGIMIDSKVSQGRDNE